MKTLDITAEQQVFTIILNDSQTAEALYQAAPFSANAQTWGDEIYFSTPVSMGPENETTDFNVGDAAYWPPGNAIAFFFGETPMSMPGSGKPMPASAATPIGKLKITDPDELRKIKNGTALEITHGKA